MYGSIACQVLQDLAINVAGEAANAFTAKQSSAFVSQSATGAGPLTLMDTLELHHWMHMLSCMVHAAAAGALREVCAEDHVNLEDGDLSESFEVRVCNARHHVA